MPRRRRTSEVLVARNAAARTVTSTRLPHTAKGLATTFDDAEAFADDLGGLTGHGGLGDKIDDFGGKWDIAREQLGDNLRSQADFMQAIVDTFRDLDTTMAQDEGTRP